MPKEILNEVPQDVSKRTIAILIIVAIILSVTSTLLAVAREPIIKEADTPTAGAEVKVRVIAPPEPVEEGAEVKVNVVGEE